MRSGSESLRGFRIAWDDLSREIRKKNLDGRAKVPDASESKEDVLVKG